MVKWVNGRGVGEALEPSEQEGGGGKRIGARFAAEEVKDDKGRVALEVLGVGFLGFKMVSEGGSCRCLL